MYGEGVNSSFGVTAFGVISLGLLLGWLFKGLITGNIDLTFIYEAIVWVIKFVG